MVTWIVRAGAGPVEFRLIVGSQQSAVVGAAREHGGAPNWIQPVIDIQRASGAVASGPLAFVAAASAGDVLQIGVRAMNLHATNTAPISCEVTQNGVIVRARDKGKIVNRTGNGSYRSMPLLTAPGWSTGFALTTNSIGVAP